MIAAAENAGTTRKAPARASEDPRDALDALTRELRRAFAERVAVDPATTPEGSSAALTIRLDGREFATFGMVDATYYWTFDGGESCHYAKDRDVMKRFLTHELTAAFAASGAGR